VPLRILADRPRGGSYLAVAISTAAMFGAFLFLTYCLQNAKGYTGLLLGAGVASAMVNTMQQAGGAIGASGLSTIFASAVSSYLHTHTNSPPLTSAAAVHGDTTAFWVVAAILAAGAILVGSLVPSIKTRATTPKPTPDRQPTPRHSRERRPSLTGWRARSAKSPALPWHALYRWVNR
jgi:hypothetical protein